MLAVLFVLAAAWIWHGRTPATDATEPLGPASRSDATDATRSEDVVSNAHASARSSTSSEDDAAGADEVARQVDAALADDPGEPRYRVEVVWGDGRPAEASAVLARSLDAEDEAGRRVATVDGAGRASFDAKEQRLWMWAERDDFASLPREARAGKTERLVLAGVVGAEGALKPNRDVPGVRMRVTCFALDGARRVKLAETFTTVDAPWSMERLALSETKQFLFRFDSDKTMPIEVGRRAMKPGDVINVDMEILAGYVRPVRVEDTDGKGIAGARVVALYVNAFSHPVTFEGVSDESGNCMLAGVPPREGELYASKKGYATTYYPYPTHALLPEDEIWTIQMPRAAPIRGRCLSASGDPAEDFDVMWYPLTSTRPHTRSFRGAPGGAFEIDEIAVGNVTILGVAEEHGQTAGVALQLTSDGVQDVELRFGSPAVVTGTVVDAIDETPLREAVIQPWSATATRNFAARGAATLTDDQGRFRSESFNVGINRFEVSAAGYAPRLTGAFAEAGKDVDAGVIRLARAQTLEVELLHGPDVISTESYATGEEVSGSRVLPPVAFDEQGRLRFRDVAPGPWRIRLMLYNGYSGEYEVVLRPGEEWKLRVDASQLRPWTLEIREADGGPLLRGGFNLTWNEGAALGIVGMGIGAQHRGRVTTHLPRVNAAFLRVVDGSGRWVLERHIGVAEFEADPYVVELGDESADYRVVDSAGRPIPGVSIASLNSGDVYRQWTSSRTDADGRAQLPHARDVMLKHETAGLGARFGLSETERVAGTYELELDAVGALEIVVRDGAFAAAGAELKVGQRNCWMTRPVTDASGVAKTLPLTAGRWDVAFEAPGYWPARATVDFKRASPPLRLDVRRLAGAHVRARSASGAPLAGIVLELTSVEFNERASQWLGAGRITSSTGGMTLDAKGELRVQGLPHGKYRWIAIAGGEGLAAGEVDLAPRAVADVDIFVP